MAVELLVGLNIVDEKAYQLYREEIAPILKQHEGAFGYDFKVSDVLQAETSAPINRVFTIYFSSEIAKKAFFGNQEYVKIKQRYFEPSVTDTTILATYLRE